MANRDYNRKQALEREVKEIYAEISIGAAGAPTLNTSYSTGVASISRTSAGLYVLTLQDAYSHLMHANVDVASAAAQDLVSQSVSDSVNSAKTYTFRTVTSAVETDPSSGSTLRVALQLKNSSVR